MATPLVHIVMGSQSDWPTMKKAAEILDQLQVEYVAKIVSAHRTPDRMVGFSKNAADLGCKVIIAGAGGAAHLPGMVAAMTHLPVVAVPVQSRTLSGIDSLLSIAQMPKGVAVATQAIGDAGAADAGLMAAQILATSDQQLTQRLIQWRTNQTHQVPEDVE